MADQRIFFEQGSDETGDTGERGDSTSIKPYISGERASESVFNRPTENMRQRTEFLRAAGEEAKYLLDSNQAWIIAAGDAAGLSGGPAAMPGISAWDPVGGTFTTSSPIVVQPINTPSSDLQETATYSFSDGGGNSAAVAFKPLATATPSASGDQKRAYNGANLLRIVWEAVPAASLASATVANYCNAVISGDPEHILTISIRDDDATQMGNVSTALAAIQTAAGELGTMGLGFVVTGTAATSLEIIYVSGGPYGLDYRMKGTFEREIHYIPEVAFSDFFAVPNTLEDGDTLSIWYADYVTDSGVQMTGRRESVPSNNTTAHSGTTTVTSARLFITSTAADVYKIPLSIPLCKRIGDDLYWMDGTVVKGAQISLPVYFGEHGNTVDRASASSSAILAADSNVTGHWLFNDIFSVGTTRAVITSDDYAIYGTRLTTAPVAGSLFGISIATTASHDVATSVLGVSNAVVVSATTAAVIGINNTVETTVTGTAIHGMYTDIAAAATDYLTGSELVIVANGVVDNELIGSKLDITAGSGSTYVKGTETTLLNAGASNSHVIGHDLLITQSNYQTGLVFGVQNVINANNISGQVAGIVNTITTSASQVLSVAGIRNVVTVAAAPGGSALACDAQLSVTDTGTYLADLACAYRGVFTSGGAAAATRVVNAGGMSLAVNIDGGALTYLDGLSISIPDSETEVVTTATRLAGIYASVVAPDLIQATTIYGAQIILDCSNTGTYSPTEAIGIKVETEDAKYGAFIAGYNSSAVAMYVEASGSTPTGVHIDTSTAYVPLHVGPGEASGRSVIERALTVGGNGAPDTDEVTLEIKGAFATHVDGWSEIDIHASADHVYNVHNVAVLNFTGIADTNSIVRYTTGAVKGQWMVLMSTGQSVTVGHGTAAGNFTLENAPSGITLGASTFGGLLLLFDGTSWREIRRTFVA